MEYYYSIYNNVNLLLVANPTIGCVGKVVTNYKKHQKVKLIFVYYFFPFAKLVQKTNKQEEN